MTDSSTVDLQQHRDERRAAAKPSTGSADEFRSEAARDCDRILYSYEFRRLANVTQVVSSAEKQLFHNRLTHSLKVAQIGRRLAEQLVKRTPTANIAAAGGLDPDVVDAACLAHDLGHPPFGHLAEQELQTVLRDSPLDSFEGNAQSFRIVTKLSFRTTRDNEPALNLTRATLRAILKYPWFRGQHAHEKYEKKWGAYESERADFAFATVSAPDRVRSLEADLMDWADDVSYAVHDVEDFYRAGLIPLDRLMNYRKEGDRFLDRTTVRLQKRGIEATKSSEAFAALQAYAFPAEPYEGTRSHREGLHGMASTVITNFLRNVDVDQRGALQIPDPIRHQVAVLNELTWFYVIDSPNLATVQAGQRRVITDLFDCFRTLAEEAATDEAFEHRLPRQLRELLTAIRTDNDAVALANNEDPTLRDRAISDYIASLTEHQAVDLHFRISGGAAQSTLDPWLNA